MVMNRIKLPVETLHKWAAITLNHCTPFYLSLIFVMDLIDKSKQMTR